VRGSGHAVVMRTAAVVIGRNEADKLSRALHSVLPVASPVVYVDSGSTDGSADIAAAMGVHVVRLSASKPFSVARARNEGFRHALAVSPDVEFVQFVDADSEMCPSWFEAAWAALEQDSRVAAAFGRLRERYPERSIFSRLYQAEFDAQFTQANACPGLSMVRTRALIETGGFIESMKGFEDTELSQTLRQTGWRVARVDAQMALHEARMGTYRQWWRRQIRSGFARGQERVLCRAPRVGSSVRQSWSIWLWGLLVPLVTLVTAVKTHGASLLLLTVYLLMIWRIRRRYLRLNPAFTSPGLYALSIMAGKVPEAIGLAQFQLSHVCRDRRPGRRS